MINGDEDGLGGLIFIGSVGDEVGKEGVTWGRRDFPGARGKA